MYKINDLLHKIISHCMEQDLIRSSKFAENEDITCLLYLASLLKYIAFLLQLRNTIAVLITTNQLRNTIAVSITTINLQSLRTLITKQN